MIWALANWRLIAGSGLVLATLFGLWVIHQHGYNSCQADVVNKENTALISSQKKGIDALSVEMLLNQSRNDKKLAISKTIGGTHDEAPVAPVIAGVLASLYGAP